MKTLTLISTVFIGFFALISTTISTTALAGIEEGSCSTLQKAQVTTQHKAIINGQNVAYTATVGFMEVTAFDASSKACIFYTSYAVKPKTKDSTRPLIFAFNGGPGSASLWLHMGALGPKRVDLGSAGLTSVTPFKLIPNDSSPLDIADIVMIDPVSTGFSHVEGDSKNEAFFGAKNDYSSIAAFVQNYLNTYKRWDSPKFIMGESYGGVRGSLLAHHLQSDLSIGIAGVILISPMLSTTPLNFGETTDNNVPYWTFFPNFATTAWYHKKIAAKYQGLTVDEVYETAKAFANTVLRDALDRGVTLGSQDFHNVAQAISDFTGISESQVEYLNLKVSDSDFFGGLFYQEKMQVGRFDGRFLGGRLPGQTGSTATDPSYVATGFPFTAAINDYLQKDLNFNFTSPYNAMVNITNWLYNSDGQEFSVVGDLSQALVDNPKLRVFIASGYFDLACPMGTVEYEKSQMAAKGLASRILTDRFAAGHMMYINPASLRQLKSDLVTFVSQQVGNPADIKINLSKARR